MPFPFSIQYNKPLKAAVAADKQLQVLQHIQSVIVEKKADNVVVDEHSVTYKGTASNMRGSLFGSISGSFTLSCKNAQWYLFYVVHTKSLFYTAMVLSVFMGVFMQVVAGVWWFGVIAFVWLFGANWLIVLDRHNDLAIRLAREIDLLVDSQR